MILDDVLLLAAPTSRSQAYLQALVAHDMLPGHVVLMGDQRPKPNPSLPVLEPAIVDLLLPRLDEPLLQTCATSGISHETCDAQRQRRGNRGHHPFHPAARGHLFRLWRSNRGEAILSLGPRFLHMHSGDIPTYRGSTTLYYALLNGDHPTVTALFLDPRIDTGPIVARRTYPKPPAGADIDHQYDSAIRADLLLRVMRTRLLANGMIDAAATPSRRSALLRDTPVLKHLAVLSLNHGPTMPETRTSHDAAHARCSHSAARRKPCKPSRAGSRRPPCPTATFLDPGVASFQAADPAAYPRPIPRREAGRA